MIKSEIICDSLNPKGRRLTTYILEYPRYIHSEIMTHRVFSKNSASSRAIPIEKFIQQIKDNPAMPEHWGKNQSGMRANEELDNVDKTEDWYLFSSDDDAEIEKVTKLEKAKRLWLLARNAAIGFAEELNRIGLHKQIANRILEPWFHMRIILSGTEFENFFALRAHKDAHPDLQKLAYLMLEQYNTSQPNKFKAGAWHIPFGDKMDEDRINKLAASKYKEDTNNGVVDSYEHVDKIISNIQIKIAVARCARISYYNYEGKDDYEADIKLCDRLFANTPKHLSPTEHVAQSMESDEWCGNFRGFKQFRKMFQDENLSDSRVVRK